MKIKNIFSFIDCMFDAASYSFYIVFCNNDIVPEELRYWNKMLEVSEDIILKSNSLEIKSLRIQIKIILYVLNLNRTK